MDLVLSLSLAAAPAWRGRSKRCYARNMAATPGPFNHIRHPKKRAFLTAFSHLGLVTRAARAAKVDRTNHFLWKRDDPEYAEAFAVAEELAAESLEDAAITRARDGMDRPVFHQGKICGYVREYSDTLLIFALKGAKPEKYRDRWSGELTGRDGKPLLDLASVENYVRNAKSG